jgi:hypothetical protein
LLLVLRPTTPYIRLIELRLIIYIPTTDLIPTQELMLDQLPCDKDRGLDVKGCKGMTEGASMFVLS